MSKDYLKYTISYNYEQRLAQYDIKGSIAHSKMLAKQGIISNKEMEKIHSGLLSVLKEIEDKKFIWKPELEDIHMNIEFRLTEIIGEIGSKLHTARSRNDQISLDMRMYVKDLNIQAIKGLSKLIKTIVKLSEQNSDIIVPGYTHMQKAMPSSVQLWSNAYIESMNDDLKLLQTAYALINQSPLGSGAGFGVPINIDRKFLAKELKFDSVQDNPIYCQLSRGKFELYIINIFTQIMFSINRIASDIVLFCTDEFKFFSLPDEFCSGSSIMPNKRNPDVLELLRGSYSILIGYQSQIQSLSQNLISGYNRDIQLSKEPTMRSFDLIKNCLDINTLVISGLIVNEENCKKAMTDELFATEQAYNMVKEGIPFRQAYRKIADELIKK